MAHVPYDPDKKTRPLRHVTRRETRWFHERSAPITYYDPIETAAAYYPEGGWPKPRTFIVGLLGLLLFVTSLGGGCAAMQRTADKNRCDAIEHTQHLKTEYHFLGGCVVQYDSNSKNTVDLNLKQDGGK